jgi:hypothetical protein
MSLTELHVLERGSQVVRGAGRVALLLRAAMEARGLTAKELDRQLRLWAAADPANRWPVDYRTIQHAMHGTACALDTYLALSGFFGWDWVETLQTPIHGADPFTAREQELERRLRSAAALHERVERERALRTAAAPRLALVAGGSPFPGSPARGPSRSFDPKTPEGGLK